LHTVFAGAVTSYTHAIANELFAPQAYMSTVLDTPGKLGDAKPSDKEDN